VPKERLLGAGGQKRVNGPELVEAHGFAAKDAMHAARLGYQGLELLRDRTPHAPHARAGTVACDGDPPGPAHVPAAPA
jgi:hypothetical protein